MIYREKTILIKQSSYLFILNRSKLSLKNYIQILGTNKGEALKDKLTSSKKCGYRKYIKIILKNILV